jgi:hypothetical protein
MNEESKKIYQHNFAIKKATRENINCKRVFFGKTIMDIFQNLQDVTAFLSYFKRKCNLVVLLFFIILEFGARLKIE